MAFWYDMSLSLWWLRSILVRSMEKQTLFVFIQHHNSKMQFRRTQINIYTRIYADDVCDTYITNIFKGRSRDFGHVAVGMPSSQFWWQDMWRQTDTQTHTIIIISIFRMNANLPVQIDYCFIMFCGGWVLGLVGLFNEGDLSSLDWWWIRLQLKAHKINTERFQCCIASI